MSTFAWSVRDNGLHTANVFGLRQWGIERGEMLTRRVNVADQQMRLNVKADVSANRSEGLFKLAQWTDPSPVDDPAL